MYFDQQRYLYALLKRL